MNTLTTLLAARWRIAVGCVALVCALAPAGADPVLLKMETALTAIDNKLEKNKSDPTVLAIATRQADVKALEAAVQTMNKYLGKDGKTTFTVEAGFNGDETNSRADIAGVEESFKINAGASISSGIHPVQLALQIKSQASSKDGTFEEELSTMRASLDYYLPCKLGSTFDSCLGNRTAPSSWGDLLYDLDKGADIEVFGFVERFTDKLMSIDQRWETGGGAKIEWSWLPALRRVRLGRALAQGLDAEIGGLQAFYESCQKRKGTTKPVWDTIKSQSKDLSDKGEELKLPDCTKGIRQAINIMKRQKARFELGLSTAVLAEFENPGALTLKNTDGLPDDVTTAFTPASDTRFRLSNRIAFTWRPLDAVTVDLRYFVKLPLDKPVTVGPFIDGDTRYKLSDEDKDIRREANVNVTYTLPDEKSKIQFSFDWYDDAGPPVVLATMPDQSRALLEARSQHRVYKMSLVRQF